MPVIVILPALPEVRSCENPKKIVEYLYKL